MITATELAHRLRERTRRAGEDPRQDVRKDHPPEGLELGAPSNFAACSISLIQLEQHRLNRPDDERQRDEEHRQDDRRAS